MLNRLRHADLRGLLLAAGLSQNHLAWLVLFGGFPSKPLAEAARLQAAVAVRSSEVGIFLRLQMPLSHSVSARLQSLELIQDLKTFAIFRILSSPGGTGTSMGTKGYCQ